MIVEVIFQRFCLDKIGVKYMTILVIVVISFWGNTSDLNHIRKTADLVAIK